MTAPSGLIRRAILGYMPANIVPAVVSMALVYTFTRLLTPEEFGGYSFVMSIVLVVQASLFAALQISIIRILVAKIDTGIQQDFFKTSYYIFASVAAIVALIGVFLSLVLPQYAEIVLIATTLLLARALVGYNQAFNRIVSSYLHFNTVECTHAILGVCLAVVLVLGVSRSGKSLLIGLMLGALVTAVFDLPRLFRAVSKGKIDPTVRSQLLRFGGPLAVTYFGSSMLQYVDRLMLGALGGDAALGLYSVAYSLVERATTVLCLAITSATFPMAVKALEHDGLEAGRRQAGRNGVLLISVATPACVGLALIAAPLATVVVGPEFRDGVAHLIPIVAFTALVRSISAHFVDHAFMLSKRSDLNFAVYVPPACVSILLSAFTIPRWGATGAALTGLVCQIGQLALGAFVGRMIFPLWLPGRDLGKMFVATAAMFVCLTVPTYPPGALGLVLMIVAGALSYGAVAIAIDLMGTRLWVLHAIGRS